MVTATGPQTLTVVGTLTNSGPVPVDDLEIRVQRGQPLGTEGDVRDALDGSAATDAVQPQFVPLPGELAPGAVDAGPAGRAAARAARFEPRAERDRRATSSWST